MVFNDQPNIDEVLEVFKCVSEVARNTEYNIVNEKHRFRAEELAWLFLRFKGINELKKGTFQY